MGQGEEQDNNRIIKRSIRSTASVDDASTEDLAHHLAQKFSRFLAGKSRSFFFHTDSYRTHLILLISANIDTTKIHSIEHN